MPIISLPIISPVVVQVRCAHFLLFIDLLLFFKACTLKFGSWTYDSASVDVLSQSKFASLVGYQANGEWDMVGFPCKRNEKRYVCCPNTFTDVTCTLHIRRRTMYYWNNLVIPCFLITGRSLEYYAFICDA